VEAGLCGAENLPLARAHEAAHEAIAMAGKVRRDLPCNGLDAQR